MNKLQMFLSVLLIVGVGSAEAASFSLTQISGESSLASHAPDILPMENQYMSYSFGQVQRNTRQSVVYRLSNTGTTPLKINEIFVEGPGFSANHNCPEVLQPQGSCQTLIYFWPAWQGFHSGRLVWSMEGGDIILSLSGYGI